MRRVSREQLRQEAQTYARRRVEHLIALNNQTHNQAHSENQPFRRPQDLAPMYERFYMRFVARRHVVTP